MARRKNASSLTRSESLKKAHADGKFANVGAKISMTKLAHGPYKSRSLDRVCSKCGELKPVAAFPAGNKGRHGQYKYAYCRECHKKYQLGFMYRKWGITRAQHQKMLELQGGLCAVCGGNNGSRTLHIDHDHHTGRIRGLLCYPCNRWRVGREREGTIFRKVADYLDRNFDGRNL